MIRKEANNDPLTQPLDGGVAAAEAAGICSSVEAVGEALEAPDLPLDGRLIISCCLPETNIKIDTGGAHYTVYTIQYEAIYLCTQASATEESPELLLSNDTTRVETTNIVSCEDTQTTATTTTTAAAVAGANSDVTAKTNDEYTLASSDLSNCYQEEQCAGRSDGHRTSPDRVCRDTEMVLQTSTITRRYG